MIFRIFKLSRKFVLKIKRPRFIYHVIVWLRIYEDRPVKGIARDDTAVFMCNKRSFFMS